MLPSTDRLAQYALEYPFDDEYVIDFKYWAKGQIAAVLSFDDGTADETLDLDSDYELTDPDDTGTLTKISDWNHAATRLTIYRTLELIQETDYRNGEALNMDTLEQDLDYSAARDQQIAEALARAATWPVTDPEGLSAELPSLLLRAGKFAAWNEEGEWAPADGIPGVPVSSSWATILEGEASSFIEAFLDAADAAAAQSTLGVPPTTRKISAGIGLSGGGDLSADRTLSWAPAYSASATYAAGDIVTYDGNVYVCILTGTNQTPAFPSTSYWKWVWSLNVTVSTDDPSGTPDDGDIWITREA